jgi:16S rRNA (cytidine1402-2'-O)-methyltransferase
MSLKPDLPPGTLTLVSTPIGNLGDMTPRGVEVLEAADMILAEDTRHTGKLLQHFGIRKKMTSYHDFNKERVTPSLIEQLKAGQNIALVSDAGTPGISDPGFYIVRAAIRADIPLSVVPGANAILPALILSGFATDAFCFEGFFPKKQGETGRVFEWLAGEKRTVVFFVSPHRLLKVLAGFEENLPDRPLTIARELTKIHEEVNRGIASELAASYTGRKVRGEIVLVVSGQMRKSGPGPDKKDGPTGPKPKRNRKST